MRFIDEAKIFLKAGDGGDGCSAFRREAHEPRGGPSGGDGGRGGDIIFRADPHLLTLADFRYNRHFKAKRGEHGQGKDRYGRSGLDLILKVPVGTLIKDKDGEILADLKKANQEFVGAKGGRGGRGNIHFKTSTNRAPRRSEPGELGQERFIILELKLLADVGLVGKPNAGKSTLLSKLSHARPKIADYPFTTLVPQLGVVQPIEFFGKSGWGMPSFTVADIPGLIEGAHEGAGLGLQFLRHIDRTRIFLHLIDVSNPEEDPLQNYQAIRKELESYSPIFFQKPEWIILTKIDAITDRAALEALLQEFKQKIGAEKILMISAATGEGIRELVIDLTEKIQNRENPIVS